MGLGMLQYVDLVPAGLKTTSSNGTAYLAARGYETLQAVCTVITTSGTIASAAAWLEGSLDGENWAPLPLESVIQAAPLNSTAWSQIGAGGVAATNTTVGFYPILLLSAATAVTASGVTVGFRENGLPEWIRASYIINTNNGALNFMIRAFVST